MWRVSSFFVIFFFFKFIFFSVFFSKLFFALFFSVSLFSSSFLLSVTVSRFFSESVLVRSSKLLSLLFCCGVLRVASLSVSKFRCCVVVLLFFRN